MAAATDRQIVIVLGAKGMGKTTLAKWLIKVRDRSRGPIIALDQNRQFPFGEWPQGFGWDRKVRDRWLREVTNGGQGPNVPAVPDEDGKPIQKRVDKRGALLFLDDADRYLPEYHSPWDDVWMANRHLYLDVLITAHRPQGIPKESIEAADSIFLFNVGEPHAIKYLSRISWIGDLANRMPTRKLLALYIQKMPHRAGWVEVDPKSGRVKFGKAA